MRLNDGRVLPAFIGQAIQKTPLSVFGDGTQTRSFCYVDDLVEGIVRLLNSDYSGPVNIGNPEEITINQFAQEILKITQSDSPINYHPLPVDDPKQRKPDITLAQTLLNWEPKVNREEGLRKTLQYFSQQIQDHS
jgi:dTDP-glucose 4,6-dehydratase